MGLGNLVITLNIKQLINNEFPDLKVNISTDDIYGDTIISIEDKDIYYSDLYQELITKINIEYLWPQNVTNVIFVFDEIFEYSSIIMGSIMPELVGHAATWQLPLSNTSFNSFDWSDPLFRKAA
jgi:hypothetical protein